jgi:hypothetical protein
VSHVRRTPRPVRLSLVSPLRSTGWLPRRAPGLAQAALALARILDNPKAISQQPAAAKTLATLLDKLRSASVRGRRGNLALVRTMTAKDGP